MDINVLQSLIAGIISFVFTLLLWLIQYLYEKKARLVYYLGGASDFSNVLVQEGQPLVNVYSHTLVVKNIGKAVAEQVEIYQGLKPIAFSIFPDIRHAIEQPTGEDVKHIIKIDYLEPDGELTLSYLYNYPHQPANFVSKIRCKDGSGTPISVFPVRALPPYINLLIKVVFYFGLLTILFLVAKNIILPLINIQ